MQSAHHFSSRPDCNNTAEVPSLILRTYCSLSNPICFRTVTCWRTMILGKIFTSFAKFQGIVSVSDIGFPRRLQELLQAPFCFLRSFCFARIRRDPLGSQVLHHDYISMTVSRFAIVTENLVICCYQVTNIFSTRYGFPIASSAKGPCYLDPHADVAVSVLREVIINTVLARYHISWRLWSWLTRRTRGYVPLSWNTSIN